MKKFFILASAAIVALASCAKTEVVYKDAPEEIAFKTVNMPMTKAAYTQDLGVAAFYLDSKAVYFDVTKFSLHNGVWTGNQYWPLADALTFAVYGPFDGATDVDMTATGLAATAVASDVDFLYAYVDNAGAGYTKKAFESSGVHLELAHTKSKVVVHVSTGTNESVTAVELLETGTTGDCAVTFASDAVVWSNANKATVNFTTDTEHLVIPSKPTMLKITYNSTSPAATGLTVSIDLSNQTMKDASDNEITETDWQPGYSYTYHININSNQINIHATEAPWVEADND
jgi:hypothetical protein